MDLPKIDKAALDILKLIESTENLAAQQRSTTGIMSAVVRSNLLHAREHENFKKLTKDAMALEAQNFLEQQPRAWEASPVLTHIANQGKEQRKREARKLELLETTATAAARTVEAAERREAQALREAAESKRDARFFRWLGVAGLVVALVVGAISSWDPVTKWLSPLIRKSH